MTIREKLVRSQAVLALGSDDDIRSMYADPVWLAAEETGAEAFELVSKHRKSYTGCLLFTAAELRDSPIHSTDLTDWGKTLRTNRAFRFVGPTTGQGVTATTISEG